MHDTIVRLGRHLTGHGRFAECHAHGDLAVEDCGIEVERFTALAVKVEIRNELHDGCSCVGEDAPRLMPGGCSWKRRTGMDWIDRVDQEGRWRARNRTMRFSDVRFDENLCPP